MDNRIIDLETQIAYQAREIAELNGVVIQLRDKVERQEVQMAQVMRALREVSPGHIKTQEEESPPPHY